MLEHYFDDDDDDYQMPIEGRKYTLFEDWHILKVMNHYKYINGDYGLSSLNLWTKLRYNRHLLEGSRSATSMRNRYTRLK